MSSLADADEPPPRSGVTTTVEGCEPTPDSGDRASAACLAAAIAGAAALRAPAGAVARADTTRASCVPRNDRTVAESAQIAAYTVAKQYGFDLWMCTAQIRAKVTDAYGDGSFGAAPQEGPGPVVVTDDRLAVATPELSNPSEPRYFMLELSVRAARASRPRVVVTSYSGLTGQVAHIALSRDGDLAWIGCAGGTAGPGSPDYIVGLEGGTGFPRGWHPYASTAFVEAHSHLEAPGRFQRYAIGCAVDPAGVAITRGSVVWHQAGTRHAARLGHPPPEPPNVGLPGVVECTGHQ